MIARALARIDLREVKPHWRWCALLVATLLCVSALALVHLPAALLLGSMAAAIMLAAAEGTLEVPAWPYRLAQGVLGCLIARSINASILRELRDHWPIFIVSVVGVIVFSIGLGGVLARFKVLPGTTAVWGAAPGAATAMALMAESFGADVRLVAFMQYLRVVVVAIVASLVARLWVKSGAAPPAQIWFPTLATGPFLITLAVAISGSVVGTLARVPAGPLLVPMALAIALSGLHLITLTLPPWLLGACYALIGWAIGMRFTRDILAYVRRAFPRVLASVLTLVAFCGALAYALHVFAGTDPLTAYLATSPGGADSVAIIAASSNVDMPFVMAMQTGRFLLVLLIGPSVARAIARWTVSDAAADGGG